jgi:hypothetical protein
MKKRESGSVCVCIYKEMQTDEREERRERESTPLTDELEIHLVS